MQDEPAMNEKRDALRAVHPPPASVLTTMARLNRCWWCWQEGCGGECPWPLMIPKWRLMKIIRNMRVQHQLKRRLDAGLNQLEDAVAAIDRYPAPGRAALPAPQRKEIR
jgi:hypothetical protein